MNLRDMKNKIWSGGITKELYKDTKDYNIRISCAKIESEENIFSDFRGYRRILKILEGKVLLIKGEEEIELIPNKTFIFKGSEHINSKNDLEFLDFNIIYNPEKIEVDIKELTGKNFIDFKGKTLIFSKKNHTTIEINNNFKITDKYDFLITNSNKIKTNGDLIAISFIKKNRIDLY